MILTPRAAHRLAALFVALLCGCALGAHQKRDRFLAAPQLRRTLNIALSWPSPSYVDALKGAVLLRDGTPVSEPEIAITRAILHDNPRIAQSTALLLAVVTARAARLHGLPPEFLAATLLQESAYDAEALSSAGAIGIAQFMPETAQEVGIDPYDPLDAIGGAATLLGGYVDYYRSLYDDPDSIALAAYNAGPVAVERYGGIPPYRETRDYVNVIFDRWAGIASYER
ncbi:MAG: lytic transglycosylase domain-containing protein [Candidatus Eremiobacteraeota bacterium]|nr:lytic transglycosylase domain-containing protein [Candidatus Eremiobacteraeota bacterium]